MFEAVPLSGHTWREAVAGVPRHFEIVAGRPTLKDTPGDDFRAALALASLARRASADRIGAKLGNPAKAKSRNR